MSHSSHSSMTLPGWVLTCWNMHTFGWYMVLQTENQHGGDGAGDGGDSVSMIMVMIVMVAVMVMVMACCVLAV